VPTLASDILKTTKVEMLIFGVVINIAVLILKFSIFLGFVNK